MNSLFIFKINPTILFIYTILFDIFTYNCRWIISNFIIYIKLFHRKNDEKYVKKIVSEFLKTFNDEREPFNKLYEFYERVI